MILGIGTDLLDIRRMEKTLERFGRRFCERVFTEDECCRCEARVQSAGCFAQRFAAKEACSKALGTGLRQGVFWRDMRVESLPSGQPVMVLSGGAAVRLALLTPPGMVADIAVSMSDDYPMAHAVVVISARPTADGTVTVSVALP
jgi:holo-[acyl-carrier protein] synthase